MGRVLILGGLVAAMLFVAWRLFGARGLFVIRVRRDGVRLAGQIPGHRKGDVIEFIVSLRLTHGATIRGLPDGRKFRLEFSGVPAGQQQQIRNYLYLKP
jgi:hypothetical protein